MKSIKIFIFLIISFTQNNNLNCQIDWELARDKKGIKVWVKDFPESNFKQFKSEVIIDAPLADLVALQLDIKNMDKWYENVGAVTLIEKVTELEGTYIINLDMPFPVRNRVSAIRAKMWYNKELKTVYVKTQYEPGILENQEGVHVKRIQSTWELQDLENGKVRILHSGYMDPSGSLPAWLANTGIKDGPIKTFKRMRKILDQYKDSKIEWLN